MNDSESYISKIFYKDVGFRHKKKKFSSMDNMMIALTKFIKMYNLYGRN